MFIVVFRASIHFCHLMLTLSGHEFVEFHYWTFIHSGIETISAKKEKKKEICQKLIFVFVFVYDMSISHRYMV